VENKDNKKVLQHCLGREQSQHPGSAAVSGGVGIPPRDHPWQWLLCPAGCWWPMGPPIANTWLPSTSFSVACAEWCRGAALSALSDRVYIFMLHPLTSHPRDDIPHRTEKQINEEKVIM